MSIKKPIFIIVSALLLLSCNSPFKQTIYDTQFEILNGQVKELSETYTKPGNDIETDITVFDKNGNAIIAKQISTRLRTDTLKYSYKYTKKGRKAEITLDDGKGRVVAYKCDTNGRAAEVYIGNELSYIPNIHLFKYNSTGDMTESLSYRYKELRFSTEFLYNRQHLLMEQDKVDTMKRLVIKTIYSYKDFDGKHNWLKRVNTVEYYFGEIGRDSQPIVRRDTITRKITYY